MLIKDKVIDYGKVASKYGAKVSDIVPHHIVTITVKDAPYILISIIRVTLMLCIPTCRVIVEPENFDTNDGKVLKERAIAMINALALDSKCPEGDIIIDVTYTGAEAFKYITSHDIKFANGGLLAEYVNDQPLFALDKMKYVKISGNIRRLTHLVNNIHHDGINNSFARDLTEHYDEELKLDVASGTFTFQYSDNISGEQKMKTALEYIIDNLQSLKDNIQSRLTSDVGKFSITFENDRSTTFANMVATWYYIGLAKKGLEIYKADISEIDNYRSCIVFSTRAGSKEVISQVFTEQITDLIAKIKQIYQ